MHSPQFTLLTWRGQSWLLCRESSRHFFDVRDTGPGLRPAGQKRDYLERRMQEE
jgi:hypothetical protein